MVVHHCAAETAYSEIPFTLGLRAPSGVRLMGLTPDCPIRLRWSSAPSGATAFRVTIGIDDRAFPVSKLHIYRLGTEDRAGTFDIRYSGAFKIQSLPLEPRVIERLARDGVELRLEGAGHLHLLHSMDDDAPVLRPHFLVPPTTEEVQDQFLERMRTPAIRHPFGWLSGCVIDGLAELHRIHPATGYQDAMKRIFFDDFYRERSIRTEAPGAKPSDGRYYGIEGTLPAAELAKTDPTHPGVQQAIDDWMAWRREDGFIGHRSSTTEGCYTIAWPMAAIASALGRDDLKQIAIEQCRFRMRYNVIDDTVWQLVTMEGKPSLPHWARGVAWYLLGTVRTLIETRTYDAELIDSLEGIIRRLPELPAGRVWENFIGDRSVAEDASGSAGIAAAIHLGVEAGLLDASLKPIAVRAGEGLVGHLTPDGLLASCAQENRGGEALQRSGYRVISQMGMGLLAQAWGAL